MMLKISIKFISRYTVYNIDLQARFYPGTFCGRKTSPKKLGKSPENFWLGLIPTYSMVKPANSVKPIPEQRIK